MPEKPATRAKTKSAPKSAKTASKEPEKPSIEASIQTLNNQVAEFYPELEELNSHLRKMGKGPEQDVKDKLLHDEDLRVEYMIRVVGKGQDPIIIQGDQTLHSFLSVELLPDALQSFQQVVMNNILRPLQVRFQKLLESRVQRRTLPEALPKKPQTDILPPPINEPKPTGADSSTDPPPPTAAAES